MQILGAGFGCDYVSSFPIAWTQSGAKTGKTGRATLGYLEHARPLIAWFENAKGFSGANLRFFVAECNRLGYFVIHEVVEAADFGSACRRLRVWFLAVELSSRSIDQGAANFQPPGWAWTFQQCLRRQQIGPGDLDSVLLPRGTVEYEEWLRAEAARVSAASEHGALRAKRDASGEQNAQPEQVVSWHVDHLNAWRSRACSGHPL